MQSKRAQKHDRIFVFLDIITVVLILFTVYKINVKWGGTVCLIFESYMAYEYNTKFWEELIRLLSLFKTFIWSTWT
jgi:hypothetical protein